MNARSVEAEIGSRNDKGQSGGDGTKPSWSNEIPAIESVVIDGRWRIVYTGPSMNPTLREPDLLWVQPYGDRPVRAGDVVCFESPEHNINIVHRVVSVRPRSPLPGSPSPIAIHTRGDNNLMDDPRVLQAGDIIGRILAAQRGSLLRTIPGGHIGQLIALSVRFRNAIWRAIPGVGSGVYQYMVRSGPLAFLLPRGLRPKLVCFNGRRAPAIKLIMGGRVVGRYDYRSDGWRIARMFRPFVDQQILPRPTEQTR